MKSKLFKQHKKNQDKELENSGAEDQEIDEELEVDSGDTGVASSKSSKMIIITASAILITLVVYFLFFKGEDQKVDNLEEVNTNQSVVASTTPPAGTPAAPEPVEDLVDSTAAEPDILEKPKLPEIPKLPELPKDLSFNNTILPSFLDTPKSAATTDAAKPNQPAIDAAKPAPAPQEPAPPLDPRKSPIIVESSGAGSGSDNSLENDRFSGGIVALNQDAINSLKETKSTIVPTLVKDRTTTIIQGKMMSAVLETAINTEIPGSIRGIISRDVYAEAGNNILIPKGSRLYGNYSTQVVRGQGRVEINWTRLIRPDGVDMKIGFVAADQFGRAGIEGDIDNKYGSVLTNSLLTSVLAIGGAIAAEKLSGGGSVTTTTSPSTGSSTTTSKPSAQVIADVSKTLIDTVGQVVGNAIDLRPVIRISQGTAITIIVNADMSIPPLKNRN